MRALTYAFTEAVASLWRGRQSGLLSTATIAVALFVLGGFLLVASNLEALEAEWRRAAELSVYLADDVGAEDRQAIDAALDASDLVAGRESLSKSDALARFKQTFGDLATSIDNPLPASVEVRLRTSASTAAVDALGGRLREMPGVADVRYDRQWLDRLQSVVALVRGVGLTLGALLTLAAALSVANVVRLALHARRDELDIMQLVGAPRAYVRGPFVMEGVLQGGLGALLALGALVAVFLVLRSRYLLPLAAAISLPPARFLSLGLCALLVAGGMAVGCVGGIAAAWNRRS